MSVLSHLEARASAAVLSTIEVGGINTSINTLQTRLNGYFTRQGDALATHFRFGSSTRGTILPRSLDDRSDIDYMIVFEKGGFNPQTYLDRLKSFVEKRYSTSDLRQSSPTIVLELNHIRFDLVPALYSWGTTYQIPDGPYAWQYTNPTDFNATLDKVNSSQLWKIKPTIRLAKIWNVNAGRVFDSFLFEKLICGLSFHGCISQTDYLFRVFDSLQPIEPVQWRNDRISRAKQIVRSVRDNLNGGYPYTAEQEIQKLIP